MSSAFEDAAKAGSLILNERHGEKFVFRAMKTAPAGPNAPRVADELRGELTVIGVYAGPPKAMFPRARASINDDAAHRSDISTPRVSVDRRLMPWVVQPFDRVERVKTGQTFEIAKVMPGDAIRTMFVLTARMR